MKIWRLLAEYDAETTVFSGCAGTPASPWTSDFNGTLIGLRVIISQAAATTLTEFVQLRLTCASWTPNTLEVGAVGNGLMTAPSMSRPVVDYEVEQPIQAGVPITIEGRNITAATPITNEVFILGEFVVGR